MSLSARASEELQPLEAVPLTLLITVWARAVASRPPWNIIDDPFALKMIQEQPELFVGLADKSRAFRRMMAVGVGVRTRCYDREVRRFVEQHPEGLILNVGCGLDARCHRLDNGLATWVDVDVAQSIAWRRKLLPDSDRHHLLEGSLTESSAWYDQVPRHDDQPMLLTVEGTLMYFDDGDIRRFIRAMVERFDGLQGFVELTGDLTKGRVHPSVRAIGSSAPFRSGFRWPAKALAAMHKDLEVVAHESLFDHRRRDWGMYRWITAIFPSMRRRIASSFIAFESRGVAQVTDQDMDAVAPSAP